MTRNSKDTFMYALGALIVIGFFSVLGIMFFAELPGANQDVGYLVVGALVAQFSLVIGYFYGSSKGSSDKTDLISSRSAE
jgi:hypothetical protein